MSFNKNRKFDHAFAIVRFDRFMADPFGFDPEQISVKQVVGSEAEADREVERLNAMNADKGALYFWRLTRIARVDEPTSGEPPSEGSSEEVIQEHRRRR